MECHIRNLAFKLGLDNGQQQHFADLLRRLFNLFLQKDASLVEINPLMLTGSDELVALDAKVNFSMTTPFSGMRTSLAMAGSGRGGAAGGGSLQVRSELHSTRRRYRLHGQRRRPGHGHHGYHQVLRRCAGQLPGCGRRHLGGAGARRPSGSCWPIPTCARVLVNIFGGIVRTDLVASGIVNAVKGMDVKVPIVIRLVGTNEEEGRRILQRVGAAFHYRDSAGRCRAPGGRVGQKGAA